MFRTEQNKPGVQIIWLWLYVLGHSFLKLSHEEKNFNKQTNKQTLSWFLIFIADPVEAKHCSNNTPVSDLFVNWVSKTFYPLDLRRHQAQTVWNGSFSHKIDNVAQIQDILNLKD